MGKSEPRFELPPEVAQRMTELVTALDEVGPVLAARFDRQSRAWKDTDFGVEVSAWIERIEELAHTLEHFDVRVCRSSENAAGVLR